MTDKTPFWICTGTNEDGEIVWMSAFRTAEEAHEFKAYAKNKMPYERWHAYLDEIRTLHEAKHELDSLIEDRDI